MLNIPDKEDGNTVNAEEFDSIVFELENAVTATGQTLSGADLRQLSKTISNYAAAGTFFLVSSTGNDYTFSVIGSRDAPTQYFNGMTVRGIIDSANTGAATINVAGLGQRAIRKNNATEALIANDLLPGIVELAFISSQNAFTIVSILQATTTRQGKVELATIAETTAGTDSQRAVTPAGVAPALADSAGRVSVSNNDTTQDRLDDKLVAGDGISLTEMNDGGDEWLEIDANLSQDPRTHVIVVADTDGQLIIDFNNTIIDDVGGGVQGQVKNHLIYKNGQLLVNNAFNSLIGSQQPDYVVTDSVYGEITLESHAAAEAGDIFEYIDARVTQATPAAF